MTFTRSRRHRHFRATTSAAALTLCVSAGLGLLRPSVTWAQTAPGAEKAPAEAGAIELPAVNVSGDAPTARTPVDGYVAERAVTATKSDTSILETPQSISVITRDQIRDQGAATLNQVLRYTPGVTPETRGAVATRYDMLKLRGFDADTYLDGLKLQQMYYTLGQVDPYFLERADVLRGPVSVLYGQARAGGLVNQTSKMPLSTPHHEIGVEFGNFNHFQQTFDTTGPIDANGEFLYRLTGINLSEDGQIDQTSNRRFAIQGALTWKPLKGTFLTVQGSWLRDPEANSYGGIPPQGTVTYNPYGTIPVDFYDGEPGFERFNRRQTTLGYQFEHEANDTWTFRANGRWLHSNQQYASVYAAGLAADYRTLYRGTAYSHDTMDHFAFDNQAQAKFDTGPLRHTVLTGVDYQAINGDYTAGFGSAPSIDVFNPVRGQSLTAPTSLNRTDVEGSQLGLYIQDQLRWNGFVVTLGTRSDWAESRSESAFARTKQFDQAFTSRAGLTYVFDNGVAPYVSYAESFTPTSGTDYAGNPFDPERGRQYEIGVKYQPPGTTDLFTAAVFDLTRSDLLTSDPAHPGLSIQAGEARSRGVELEARFTPIANLEVIASYTYLDTTWEKDNSGLQGLRLPAVPHHMGSLWAKYALKDVAEGPLSGLSVAGGVRHNGSTVNSANTFTVPSFTLVDAALTYDLGVVSPKLEGAQLTVNGKNLLNKEYVASCYYGNWCAYGYQRTVTAGLRYQW